MHHTTYVFEKSKCERLLSIDFGAIPVLVKSIVIHPAQITQGEVCHGKWTEIFKNFKVAGAKGPNLIEGITKKAKTCSRSRGKYMSQYNALVRGTIDAMPRVMEKDYKIIKNLLEGTAGVTKVEIDPLTKQDVAVFSDDITTSMEIFQAEAAAVMAADAKMDQ